MKLHATVQISKLTKAVFMDMLNEFSARENFNYEAIKLSKDEKITIGHMKDLAKHEILDSHEINACVVTQTNNNGKIIGSGWCEQSINDNLFGIFISDKAVGGTYTLNILYSGERYKFMELLKEYDIRLNDWVSDIIEYETSGPKDMVPWETKDMYFLRKGGHELSEEVANILKTNYFNIEEDFKFGLYNEESLMSNYFKSSTMINPVHFAILCGWFNVDDLELREQRVSVGKSYLRSLQTSREILKLFK